MFARSRAIAVRLALVCAVGCEGKAGITYQSPPASAASASWTFDGDTLGGFPAGAEVFSAEFPAVALGPIVYGYILRADALEANVNLYK